MLLHLIGPAGQKIFNTVSDTGDKYQSAIASLESYFMPKKNLIYKRYNFLSARQNSAETVVFKSRVCDFLQNPVTMAVSKKRK